MYLQENNHRPMWKPCKNDDGQLPEHDIGKVNDECIDKIISTFGNHSLCLIFKCRLS